MAADDNGKGAGVALVGFKKDHVLLRQEERQRGGGHCSDVTKEQRLDAAYPGA